MFWIGLMAGLGWFDLWRNSKHDGSTLSEVTRVVFCTSKPIGRAAFGFSLGHLYIILWRHIIR